MLTGILALAWAWIEGCHVGCVPLNDVQEPLGWWRTMLWRFRTCIDRWSIARHGLGWAKRSQRASSWTGGSECGPIKAVLVWPWWWRWRWRGADLMTLTLHFCSLDAVWILMFKYCATRRDSTSEMAWILCKGMSELWACFSVKNGLHFKVWVNFIHSLVLRQLRRGGRLLRQCCYSLFGQRCVHDCRHSVSVCQCVALSGTTFGVWVSEGAVLSLPLSTTTTTWNCD